MINESTWNQWADSVKAAGRNVASYAAGAVSVLTITGMNPDNAKHLVQAVSDTLGAFGSFMAAAGPLVGAAAAAYAAWKATRSQKAKSVGSIPGTTVVVDEKAAPPSVVAVAKSEDPSAAGVSLK